MAECSLTELMADACTNGFTCMPENLQRAVIIQFLCNISDSGGIGGGGQIKTYTTDPNSELVVPDNLTSPAIAYSADGSGSIYGWSVATQSWV